MNSDMEYAVKLLKKLSLEKNIKLNNVSSALELVEENKELFEELSCLIDFCNNNEIDITKLFNGDI